MATSWAPKITGGGITIESDRKRAPRDSPIITDGPMKRRGEPL